MTTPRTVYCLYRSITKRSFGIGKIDDKSGKLLQAAAAGTMLNESEWNAQHDQESLENLQKAEEELETLLAEHLKSIGYGPVGQGSN